MEKRLDKHLSLRAMEELLKQGGCNRISDEAKFFLRDMLEDEAKELAAVAWRYAQHAGRKTIKKVDIVAAIKEKKEED